MNYDALEQNIIDMIEEQQLKLGYLPETVRLYYPLSSLNRFLGMESSIEEMTGYLLRFSEQTKARLGGIVVSNQGERFCIAVPPEGAEYIHTHQRPKGFLADLINTIQRHGCTLEEVLNRFYKYSEHVHVEKVDNGEFDYLVYFEDGVPDSYRYCLSVEDCHIIYHRYTIGDYEDFGF